MIFPLSSVVQLNSLLMTHPYFLLLRMSMKPLQINKDLKNMNKWAQQWKMSFNHDPTKMAEVLFSRKKSKVIHLHPSLILSGKNVSRSESHKHLGLMFYLKLNFDMHLKAEFSILNNGIALLRKLRHSKSKKPISI